MAAKPIGFAEHLDIRTIKMTIKELKTKHRKLKKLDGSSLFKSPTYKVFGSDFHKYRFSYTLSYDDLAYFENLHSVKLPADYYEFLTEIGNGGSGPAYGLFPLSKWNYDLEITDKNFLSTDFPHTTEWNLPKNYDTEDENYFESKDFLDCEDDYYSNKQITGSLRICHYGCAIYYLLVITGNQAGYIWVDDRASDNGIYPAVSKFTGKQMTFMDWYDEWLTENLAE